MTRKPLACLVACTGLLVAGAAQAQTGLTTADQYFLYFNAQSNARQLQRTQVDQQRNLLALQKQQSQYLAPRPVTAGKPLLSALDGAPRGRSPQLAARPLPAVYGGPGATRKYFQHNPYFNPR